MKTAFAAASLAAFLAAPSFASAAEPEAYEFDKTHTAISASWVHLGYSEMSIYFTDYDGVLLLDFEEPSNSTVDVTFNIADGFWVGAGQERFEGHLNSPDLFDTAQFPTARFIATSFDTEDGTTGTMTGDLTLLGQTNPVTLDVTLNARQPHPFSGAMIAGLSASGTILRSDWGLGFAVPNVSDELTLSIETELALVTDEAE